MTNRVPLVSEAVVDMSDDTPEIPRKVKTMAVGEKTSRQGGYLIPIIFSAIALALILVSILSGIDLAIFGR